MTLTEMVEHELAALRVLAALALEQIAHVVAVTIEDEAAAGLRRIKLILSAVHAAHSGTMEPAEVIAALQAWRTDLDANDATADAALVSKFSK